VVAKAFDGVAGFVLSTQVKDGGFRDTPATTNEENILHRSSMASTSQALYILESLRAAGLFSISSPLDPVALKYYDANSYLRACLSLPHGVLAQYPSDESDLEATYYFLHLVNAFPSLSYGIPRSVQITSVALGVVCLMLALFSLYSTQIPNKIVVAVKAELKMAFLYLTIGAVCLQFFPSVAIVVYLGFAIHLAIQFYEAQADDTVDGVMVLIAAVNSFGYMGLVLALFFVSPFAFTFLPLFYTLLAWAGIVTLIATLGGAYSVGIKKVRFYVSAGYLSWVLNTVLFYGYLYGKGDFELAYRLIVVHGHFPAVFILLPTASLLINYATSALAAVLYFGGSPKAKGEKKKAAKAESADESVDSDKDK